MRKNYEDLANAIILQAMDDYVFMSKSRYSLYAESGTNNRKEIREFIFGEWFTMLSDIDPYIIYRIITKERYLYANGVHKRAKARKRLDDAAIEEVYKRDNKNN